MSQSVVIRFEDPEQWEDKRQQVDDFLEKHTGTSDYPTTKSFPPIIFGAELTSEAISELKGVSGVIVDVPDEE